jgi:hypothetical protein
VLTLRDINRALDDLGLEPFMPPTMRRQARRERRERSRHVEVLRRALSRMIRGRRDRRLARREARELPAGVTVIVVEDLRRRRA